MNTHYTKDDVVELASVIFCNDINSETVAESGIPTEGLAEASFYAAEVFFNKAAAYHRGELDQMLDSCHGRAECSQCSAPEPEDQRKAERRSNVDRRGVQQKGCSETSTEEEEAFRQLEQALKEQFLAATLQSIFRNAKV